MAEENINEPIETISFSVDAGIINRLGKELVGRAETAVSELVKNAYDADATIVELYFINTNISGGELHIIDDGSGMAFKELVDGFMRLSSSDKVHNPISPIYKRLKAGKKGIGRFATQRLGSKLTILTKPIGASQALKLDINWDKYEIDKDLQSIKNPISREDVDFKQGTKLIIKGLREAWDDPSIKRIYRYISDLLQPNFLSERSREINIAVNKINDGFDVRFIKRQDEEEEIIADLETMVFDNALSVIEGYLLNGQAIVEVKSERFSINDIIHIEKNFSLLEEVHFKAYYFIYNYEWYEGLIQKSDYNKIADFGEYNGGIKLYRNGFRVLPYGERGNDWVNIDKTSVKTFEGGYVPFNNQNFFGFVELIDPKGLQFEETSSREGLIENDAFKELINFLHTSLRTAAQRVNSARLAEKKDRSLSRQQSENFDESDSRTTKDKLLDLKGTNQDTNSTIDEAIHQLEELEMMRILAGLGLNIAEFTHEIRQFIPSFNGSINYMISQSFSPALNETLYNLKENFNRFRTYTAYIDHTITLATSREKRPINLINEVREFHKVIRQDLEANNIEFEFYNDGFGINTRSMHPSEWTSILYNLYTNSKKAIKRKKAVKGRIKVVCGMEEKVVYLEFMDNGDGIAEINKERIFDAFFTTSSPPSNEASKNEALTGTGLGLKIVKDIVVGYNGKVFISQAEEGFTTCLRIEIRGEKIR